MAELAVSGPNCPITNVCNRTGQEKAVEQPIKMKHFIPLANKL